MLPLVLNAIVHATYLQYSIGTPTGPYNVLYWVHCFWSQTYNFFLQLSHSSAAVFFFFAFEGVDGGHWVEFINSMTSSTWLGSILAEVRPDT